MIADTQDLPLHSKEPTTQTTQTTLTTTRTQELVIDVGTLCFECLCAFMHFMNVFVCVCVCVCMCMCMCLCMCVGMGMYVVDSSG